jgi:hypothetical protein
MGFLNDYKANNPNENVKRVVNIEWVLKLIDNTNTTYSAGTGLSLSDTTFSINLGANLTFTGIINVPTPTLPD